MDENASQQSNEKLLMKENLQYHRESTSKLARTVPTQGIETGVLNRLSVLEILLYFALVFNFVSPKWTRTKIGVVISLSLRPLKSTTCTEVLQIALHIS